jgi:hypothetical protein
MLDCIFIDLLFLLVVFGFKHRNLLLNEITIVFFFLLLLNLLYLLGKEIFGDMVEIEISCLCVSYFSNKR